MEFCRGDRTYFVNFAFDCNLQGVIYFIRCIRFCKNYVGNSITKFKRRFNYKKRSVNRYLKGQRGMSAEQFYAPSIK